MRLLVTRPEPDALRLQALLEDAGHEATVEPLLSVSFDNADPIDLESAQALIATSRNALRSLKSSPALLEEARHLPLFAVGRATATEARTLGFETVITGAGTGAELVGHIVSALDPAAGLLVHLAGDILAANLKDELEGHGFRIAQPVVYRMIAARAFSDDAVEQFATGEIEGVILMSPRTAAIYAELVRKAHLTATIRPLPHFCLSAPVARRLEPLGGDVVKHVAEAPLLEEVLALIDEVAAQLND